MYPMYQLGNESAQPSSSGERVREKNMQQDLKFCKFSENVDTDRTDHNTGIVCLQYKSWDENVEHKRHQKSESGSAMQHLYRTGDTYSLHDCVACMYGIERCSLAI